MTVLRAGSAHGRTAAALLFRVGRFDETLPASGITHLVEHLALSGHQDARYEFNAEVSGRYTSFFMESADPADVAGFVTAVCRGLAADGRDALEQHKRILRTEAASRGGSGARGACLSERFGAAGPGLAAYDEFGLLRLSWREVEQWRSRWFVAGNAVLWVAGDLPAALRIDLPAGPPPIAAPLQHLPVELPGFLITGRGGVGISLAGPRSWAATVTLDVLRNRLTRVLRHERGLSYSVQLSGELCDGDFMDSWLAADALPDQIPMAAHMALTVIEGVADRGCDREDIEEHLRRRRDILTSPAGPVVTLQLQAHNILDGRRAWEADEVLQELGRVSPGDVAAATRDLLSRAIVVTPTLVPAVQGRMPRLPLSSSETVPGTAVQGPKPGVLLTMGDTGLMLTAGEGQRVTIRYASVAAMLRWNDGQCALVGNDGFVLRLHPADWPEGERPVQEIQSRVDPLAVVRIDEPGPAAPGREPPQDTGASQRQDSSQGPGPGGRRAPRGWRGWRSRILGGLFVAWTMFGSWRRRAAPPGAG